ncbi:hypothetical protein Droror1_Dr00000288 [Drosera rotundifolia]
MGSLLSSTEDDLLLKASELECIELQLKEELYARASIEDAPQICEAQFTGKAIVLDEIINYVQSLKGQVETLAPFLRPSAMLVPPLATKELTGAVS